MTLSRKQAGVLLIGLPLVLLVLALFLVACGDNSTPASSSARLTPTFPPPTPTTMPVEIPNLEVISGVIEKPGNPTIPSTTLILSDGRRAVMAWDQSARILTNNNLDASFATFETGMKLEVRGRIIDISEKNLVLLPVQIRILDFGANFANAAHNDQQARAAITEYFKAITDHNYEAAYNLLAYQSQKQEQSLAQYSQHQMDCLKAVNEVKVLEGPLLNNDNNNLRYKVSLMAETGSKPDSWQPGLNLRWLTLVRENGFWHIANFAPA